MANRGAGDRLLSSTATGVLLFFVIMTTGVVVAVDMTNCKKALGMASGDIQDLAITASSSYDNGSVGPSNARIRTERNGGAWCPFNPITRGVEEWIEIDLQELKVITQVETQGRFGNGQGQEFAEAYLLKYKRTEGKPWVKFKDRKGNEVFHGNTNTYIAEMRDVIPPIVTRKIRIIPYSNHPRTVCMRLELYGCLWRDGVLSYSMPQGEKRGTEVDLFDFTYDGKVTETNLTDGLGQLTDGMEGHSNFRLDLENTGKKGYEWIGWKNESSDRAPIEIIFEFEKVRNFTAARFHCNNMFTKEVRIFRRAVLYFSVGGAVYQDDPIVFDFMRDTLIEFARNVIIQIHSRVGRFIKVVLFFDAKWMMISEVRFESEIVSGNYSEELLPFSHVTHLPWLESSKNQNHIVKVAGDLVVEEDQSRPAKLFDDQIIGIIVGTLGVLVLLVIGIIIFCLVCRRQHSKYNNGGSKMIQQQQVSLKFHKSPVSGSAAAPSEKVSKGNTYSNIVTCDNDMMMQDTLSSKSMLFSNGDTYRQPHDVIQTRRLPELPRIPVDSAGYLSDTNTSTYAVPDVACISGGDANNHSLFPSQTSPSSALTNLYDRDSSCSSALIGTLHGSRDPVILQYSGADNDNLYPTSGLVGHHSKEDLTIIEFPRDNLKFVEKLGEGLFGEVHLCEAVRIQDVIGDDFLLNRLAKRPMLVAVKVLCKSASVKSRDDFYKEVRIMSRLKDPNIVSLLGVCTREDPFCVVVEYMKYGDLNQFLQSHVASESTLARNLETKTLSYGCLIYMATQIASGMKFLEKLNVIHRDLATRNCLVGHQYMIKISDFGMSQTLYSADYYRIEGKAVLPIRWMAWESVLLGKFSSKSDVWSFGIALWEILTFAREQPFDGLSDEQVIENCGHYYHSDQQQICLSQPPNCPKEIYDLMVQCWSRDHVQRPEFREVHMFLERKNHGYNPTDERQGLLQNTTPSFV